MTDRELLIAILKLVMNIIYNMRKISSTYYDFSVWDDVHTEANDLLKRSENE